MDPIHSLGNSGSSIIGPCERPVTFVLSLGMFKSIIKAICLEVCVFVCLFMIAFVFSLYKKPPNLFKGRRFNLVLQAHEECLLSGNSVSTIGRDQRNIISQCCIAKLRTQRIDHKSSERSRMVSVMMLLML